jgi:hypothetical protein
MKIHYMPGILLAFLLTAGGTAQAGQCTTEIDQLQKLLSKSNAQLEPSGKVVTADPGQSEASQSGTSQLGTGQQAGTAGDAAGSNATNGGKPASLNVRTAQESLTRARKLDEAGNEQACQDEMAKAKAAFGAQ